MRPTSPHAQLSDLLAPEIARELAHLSLDGLPGPRELALLEERLAASPGAELVTVGHSSAGRPIRMLSLGSGPRSVLCWGYPHPDEPLGAAALAWWAQRLAAGGPDAGARWHFVLCADPDIAALNESWIRGGSLEDFIFGAVRLEHVSREVDYGFPIDAGLFHQPEDWYGARACHEAGRCVSRECGPTCLRFREPPGPLPESLALVAAIRRARPDLVGSMHDTHTGGCFTFLRQRPDDGLAAAMSEVPGACGLPRHLGLKIDSGLRWRRGIPDLIREPDLASEERRFRERHRVDEELRYLGNMSAAQHLESVQPDAEFIVPEAGHFWSHELGDTAPLAETRAGRAGWIATRRGPRFCLFADVELPDGSTTQTLVQMGKQASGDEGDRLLPVTLGWLGAEAITRRRHAFAAADELWASLPERIRLSDHPIAAERRSVAVPGRVVNDRSLLIFRVAERSAQPASVAEAWDLRVRWAIHSAVRIGALSRLVEDEAGPQQTISALRSIARGLVREVPTEARRRRDPDGAARSQLARVLLALR